ncbi:MAG: peptidoglycan recognition family protein [Actinomycetota bacterium]
MCTDCGRQDVSRRRFIAAGAAGALAAPTLLKAAARADERPADIICRAAWGAKPPSGKFKHHEIQRVTIHHSGVVLAHNSDAPAALRGAQAYHQSSGFPDIAYHFMIDRHGHIYKGRPRWARGDTFTDYPTKGHLLLMCEGNFEEQDISSRQLASLCDVAAWATRLFDIPLDRIRGHRDYAATAGPGEDLYRRLENGTIKKEVRRRTQLGGISLEQLCGKKGKRLVHRIEMGLD